MTTAELAVLLDLAAHAPRVQDQKFLLARLAEQGTTEKAFFGYRLTPSGRELVAELLRIATDHVSLYTALRRSLRRAGAKDRG